MSEQRRIAAIVLLFLIGFGLIALASSLGATWPLLLTPLPYATIAWIVVHGDEDAGTGGTAEAR
jgi:cell division septal protein FtsQ